MTAPLIIGAAYSPDGSALVRLGQTAILNLTLQEPGESGPVTDSPLEGRFFAQRILDKAGAVLAEVDGQLVESTVMRFTLVVGQDLLSHPQVAADLTHEVVEFVEGGEETVLSRPFSIRRLREGLPQAALSQRASGDVIVKYEAAPGRSAAQQLVDAGEIEVASAAAMVAWLKQRAELVSYYQQPGAEGPIAVSKVLDQTLVIADLALDSVFDIETRTFSVPGQNCSPRIQAAFDVSEGRPVWLPAGVLRLAEPIRIKTKGRHPGPDLRGQGFGRTILVCDFDGDPFIFVDGSSQRLYRWAEGGGFRDLSLIARAGRNPGPAIQAIGWSYALLTNVEINGFEHGIHTPQYVDPQGVTHNPDASPCVMWGLSSTKIVNSRSHGIYGENGPGHAGWLIDSKCAIQHNGGDGVRGRLGSWWIGGTVAWNGKGPDGGYGVCSLDEAAWGAATNLTLDRVETDGNKSGGYYLSGVVYPYILRARFIARVLNGTECQPVGVRFDPTKPSYPVIEKSSFRVNLVGTDQDVIGFAGDTMMVDAGDGGGNVFAEINGYVTNLTAPFTVSTELDSPILTVTNRRGVLLKAGQTVAGAGIPIGARVLAWNAATSELTITAPATASASGVNATLSVPFALASEGPSNPARNLFPIRAASGRYETADRRSFYLKRRATQAWTSTPTSIIGNASLTGWQHCFDPLTGLITIPFRGDAEFGVQASFTGNTANQSYLGTLRKGAGGAPLANLSSDRLDVLAMAHGSQQTPVFFRWIEEVMPGDTFDMRVFCATGPKAPVNLTTLTVRML